MFFDGSKIKAQVLCRIPKEESNQISLEFCQVVSEEWMFEGNFNFDNNDTRCQMLTFLNFDYD